MLEQISSELRAEINQLKESTHFAMDEQSLREQEESHRVIPMQSRIDKKTRPNSYRPLRIEDSAVLGEQIEQATSGKASPESNLCRTIPTNQKGPKKLHDLIRERKQL